jgi:hypothetical protein
MLLNQLFMGKTNSGMTDKTSLEKEFGNQPRSEPIDNQANSLIKEAARLIVSRFLYPGFSGLRFGLFWGKGQGT